MAQVRGTGSLGDKPLAVVSAGERSPDTLSASYWLELQDELASLSSTRSHRIVAGATHESLLHDGRASLATSAAILEVVKALRNNQLPAARPVGEASARQAQL